MPTSKTTPSQPTKPAMINTIHINRLALHGHHGVMPQEQLVGAMFYVTLSIDVEVSNQALLHDQLSGTVSYADIIALVRQEMSIPAALLEHLAHRIGHKLLTTFPTILSLSIRIDKENPPCGANAESIGVEIRLCR